MEEMKSLVGHTVGIDGGSEFKERGQWGQRAGAMWGKGGDT